MGSAAAPVRWHFSKRDHAHGEGDSSAQTVASESVVEKVRTYAYCARSMTWSKHHVLLITAT